MGDVDTDVDSFIILVYDKDWSFSSSRSSVSSLIPSKKKPHIAKRNIARDKVEFDCDLITVLLFMILLPMRGEWTEKDGVMVYRIGLDIVAKYFIVFDVQCALENHLSV